MYLSETALISYRNYSTLHKEWNPGINILLGHNAQGKTNFLESIYMLSMGKSHRTSKDKELIQWGSTFSVIKGTVIRNQGPLSLEVQITEKGKKVKINGIDQRRLSDYVGVFNIVLFAPEDLDLVKGAPHQRRRFLDMEIGQVSPAYLYYLNSYNKILLQRNQLLKEIARQEKKSDLLSIWDEQLVDFGIKIIFKRFDFLSKLKIWAKEIHKEITSEKEDLKIIYKGSLNISEESTFESARDLLLEQLNKNREREIYRGMTLIGPHRDDLSFFINEQNVQIFGSQGQQRTTALSLKLAEIELIYQEIGEYPVLLLDDVFSELDESRQTHLLRSIKDKCQTFVTTTSTEGIIADTLKEAQQFWIDQGVIVEK